MNEKLLNQQEKEKLNLMLELLQEEKKKQMILFELIENMLKSIVK